MTEKRSFFDWIIFLLMHICIIGGISIVGFYVYGPRLAVWVAVSATVAGLACTYLYHKDVPGEVPMKCMLYLCVALNAGYLAHNGARNIGIKDYNAAQVEKYEKGMAEAGKSGSRRIAATLALSAKSASELEKAFSDGVSMWVAILAFLELAMALMIFAISSRRREIEAAEIRRTGQGTRVLNPVAMPLARDLKYTRRVPGMAPARVSGETTEGKDHRR